MCGRARQVFDWFHLKADLHALGQPPDNLAPNWNAAPRQSLLVVRATGEAAVEAVRMVWGFVPRWERDPAGGRRPINAMTETIAANLSAGRGMWADAFRHRRCLFPVDGFYEWQRDGTQKQPYAIDRADGRVMGLAALWDRWRPPGSDAELVSFAVITCPPNAVLAPIHTRMPVVLDPADYASWLGGSTEAALALCRPCPPESVIAYRVGARVGNVRNNDPSVAERLPA